MVLRITDSALGCWRVGERSKPSGIQCWLRVRLYLTKVHVSIRFMLQELQNWTYCIINHVLIWALWLWHASNCYTSDEWYKQTNIEWCIPDGNNTLSGQLIPLLTTEMSYKTWQDPRILVRNAWYFLLRFAQKYHWALRIASINSFFGGKQRQIS